MDGIFGNVEFASAMSCSDSSTGFKLFNREGAGAVILGGHGLEVCDELGLKPFSQEELWCFAETNDCNSADGHEQDHGAADIHQIAPSLVVMISTGRGTGTIHARRGCDNQRCRAFLHG
jgi:hypothetical protein